MTTRIFIAFLVFAILAGCIKENVAPDTGGLPIAQSPFGLVNAPYLVVSLQSGSQFKMEKYLPDGSFRAKLLDDYFTNRHFINDPDFSAKGDRLCYAEARSIIILDVNSKNWRQVAGDIEDVVGSTEMSPDGSRIAYLSWNNGFSLDLSVIGNISEATPIKLTNFEDGAFSAGPPSFSPDGNKIVFSISPHIAVSDWNGTNMFRVHESTGLFENAFYPIFNKDGTRLIYFLQDDYGALNIVSSPILEDGGNNRSIVTQLAGYLIVDPKFPVLSDDGNNLYFVGTSYGYTNLYKVPAIGGTPVKIASDVVGPTGFRVVGLDFVEP